MAFARETKIGFLFREQAEFDTLIANRALEPGCFYFVGKMFHIAFTTDTYRTYSSGMTVQEIINEILQDELISKGVDEVTTQIINDLRTLITNEFVEQIVTDVTEQSILQIISSLQHATNERHGIVKGQDNTSPDSWHKVSADEDGTLSINRELLEDFIDEKVGDCDGGHGSGTPLDKAVAEPDRSIVGIIENRDLVLQQTTPEKFGVVKCRPNCPCYRKPLGLESMDGMLIAELKQGRHLFYPMVFPKKLPPHMQLFDKLTFIESD
jgi:hypothetical protein